MVYHPTQVRATREERAYMALVKDQPCCVCTTPQQSITECHHITVNCRRLGHFFCLPLCYTHHDFVTHRRKRFEETFGTQRSLWEALNQQLNIQRDWPENTRIITRSVV